MPNRTSSHVLFSLFVCALLAPTRALPALTETEDLESSLEFGGFGWTKKQTTRAPTLPPTLARAESEESNICTAALKPKRYEMKMKGCPIAEWFRNVPKSFSQWEARLLEKFVGAWKASGHSPSADENDHNYNTLLGQGNTLGFISATLEIDPSEMDRKVRIGSWWNGVERSFSKYKTGLFANKRSLPAVGRFSDFGADDSIQIGRLALKLNYDQTLREFAGDEKLPWAGEMNLLLTETLETFPLGGFEALANFAEDDSTTMSEKLLTAYQGAKSILGNIWSLLREFNKGDVLAKTYYSQLPYRIVGTDGTEAAFRFRLRPLDIQRESVPREAAKVRDYMRRVIGSTELRYAFEVTIADDPTLRKTVETDVSADWGLPWIPVGTLRLPSQSLNERAMSKALHSSLVKALSPMPAAEASLDKMFFFHPVMTSMQHHGVGEIQAFRADFYAQHAHARFETYLNIEGFWPNGQSHNQPPYSQKFPFCAIDAKSVGWAANPPKCH